MTRNFKQKGEPNQFAFLIRLIVIAIPLCGRVHNLSPSDSRPCWNDGLSGLNFYDFYSHCHSGESEFIRRSPESTNRFSMYPTTAGLAGMTILN